MERCSSCQALGHFTNNKEKLCNNCLKTRPSSNYKRCTYCMSDFKLTVPGSACLKCQELEKKFGPPIPCKICSLQSAFGNSTSCQRCSHYQSKFGSPVTCQHCHRNTAFYKDAESRKKVANAILCFLCTYNYKLKRARERQDQRGSRKRSKLQMDEPSSTGINNNTTTTTKSQQQSTMSSVIASNNTNKLSSSTTRGTSGLNDSTTSMPSESGNYADPTMTILAITEESKELRKKMEQKDRDLLAKTRELNEIRGEMEDLKETYSQKIAKLEIQLENERTNFWSQMDKLRKENAALQRGSSAVKKMKTSAPSTAAIHLSPPQQPTPPLLPSSNAS